MVIITASPSLFDTNSQELSNKIAETLRQLNPDNHLVVFFSNHEEPDWFGEAFPQSNIIFKKRIRRQDGDCIKRIAKKHGIGTYDILTLVCTRDDLQMAKNGHTMMVSVNWATDDYIRKLAMPLRSPKNIADISNIISQWKGHWWYSNKTKDYTVHSLSDLSSINKGADQEDFYNRMVPVIKCGGTKLNAFLALVIRSFIKDKYNELDNLMFCTFPSSSSRNDDTETLSPFTHKLRISVSNVKICKVGEPLFLRHSQSIQRHKGKSNREDPINQITTLHLNPKYKRNIKGRNVVVIDDCCTHGLSFGVAAAFLKKAGATSVIGLSLGKLGDCIKYFDIDIKTDPFKPVAVGDYSFNYKIPMPPNPIEDSIQVQLRDILL